MANIQRYRTGQQMYLDGLIDAGVKAQIGDLMMTNGDYLQPLSEVAAASVATVDASFAGCLVEGATSGNETEDSKCLVGYNAEYEYDLDTEAADDYPSGTPVKPVVSGSVVSATSVAIAADRTDAIGTLARYCRTGDTKVIVRLISAAMQNKLA